MKPIATAQATLFDSDDLLPPGLAFEPAFISPADEAELLAIAATLPLRQARFRQYTARRQVFVYGARIDAAQGTLRHAAVGDVGDLASLPPPLVRLRDGIAAWAGVAADDFVHLMVSEYAPGTPLGWHRDAPQYERVVGLSLGGPARLRFRPWAPDGPAPPAGGQPFALDLAPRSVYRMSGVARWGWQHSVPPVPALRYSITLRTARVGGAAGAVDPIALAD